jgi:hypothetical protein
MQDQIWVKRSLIIVPIRIVTHAPGQLNDVGADGFLLDSLIVNDLSRTAETVPRREWTCLRTFTDGGDESGVA